MKKLRISHLVVQPVIVWDDGEELTPGPELGAVSVPLSKLSEVATTFPAQLVLLQEKLLQEEALLGESKEESVSDN
jgi:hypothetical protein